MKHRFRLTFALVAVALVLGLPAFAQFRWLKGGGTAQTPTMLDEGVWQICSDANGNVYALSEVANLAITADTFHRSGAFGNTNNVLITSFNCYGQMRWAKLIGSSAGVCTPYDITTDSLGHVYVSGFVTNNSLYVGDDTVVTTALYQRQAIMQFDTLGDLKWMRYVGDNTMATWAGSGSIYSGTFLATDNANNIHFICSVQYGVHITPSLLSHLGTYDLTYDPLGNLLGVNKLQIDSTLGVYYAAIDKSTNYLYASGYRLSAFPDSSMHNYVAAFDLSRSMIWKDTLINTFLPGAAFFTGISADNNGCLYLAGRTSDIAIYRHDTVRNSLLSGGYGVSFILKTRTDGSPVWIRGISATSGVNQLSDLILYKDKLAAAGVMTGKLKTGIDSIISYSGEGQNAFFTVFDTAGSLFTMQQLHGAGFYDAASAITTDKNGGFYIGGRLETNIWGGTLTPYTSFGGSSDFFLMKYGADCGCTATPVASFTAVGTHTVNFTYTGTAGSSPLDSVRWFFGDGTTSTILSPTHVYSAGGTFNACVRVYSPCGGDVECHDIVITCPYSPVASFTSTGLYNKSFTYTGTTVGVDSIRWKFGDGGTSPLTSPTHTYLAPGTYTACVTAYTWCAWDSTCVTFTIPCASSPIASFVSSGTTATRNFTYTGTSIARDSIRWYFGDGGTSTTVNPSHTYTAIGVYTVCVTFYNPCGSSTVCHTVTVNCITAPTATYSYTGAANTKNFTFTGTTTGIDSVGWNFGDGWRSTGLTATHSYTSIGTFHACAKVYSACGNDTECYDIFVPCITPTVTFTHSATSADSTGHFIYTGSTTSVDSIRWSFGDGATDTGVTSNHHYHATGIYTVCAVAYSTCGNDTLCDTIKIYSLSSVYYGEHLTAVIVLPNPAYDELTVEHAANCDFAIYNLLGQKLIAGHISENSELINVSRLPNAVYIIQVKNSEGSQKSFRLIKE